MNFLLSSRYGGERDALLLELGDTTVTGSANTFASLSRRGLKAELTWKDFVLQGFGVLGAEKLSQGNSSDELGLGFNANDHIMGASLQGKFLDGRLRAALLYINGGQRANFFGQWHQNSEVRRGDVAGLVLGGDFFDGKLSVEGEYDMASFDYETFTPGEVEEKEDIAFRLQVGGNIGVYQYALSYKYFGPYYQVVGGQTMRDWAGFELSASRNGERHSLQFFSSYSHDNVEDDPLYATLYSLSAGMGWNYSGWEKFPVGLRVEYTNQNSEDEPTGSLETSMQTGTISGDISYQGERWSVGLMSSYSEQDDRTSANYDSRLFSITCTPSYTTERFSVMASLGYNGFWDLVTDVRTDTNTLSLDARTSFFNQALGFETGVTYDITSTDDDSVENSNLSLHARMSYAIDKLWKFENSTLALECIHNYREDEISDTTMENTVLTLVLSSSLPLSL